MVDVRAVLPDGNGMQELPPGILEVPSTRYEDLVDLVAILSGAELPADASIHALRS